MGVIRKISVLFPVLFLLVLGLPGRAFAAPAADEVVLGGTFTLEADETLEGDLLVIGGAVEIESGAAITGAVTQLGGSLHMDGRVGGDITQLGGSLVLGADAHVEGDIQAAGGSFDRAEGARVDGAVRTGWSEVNVSPPEPPNRFAHFILDSFWNLFRIFASAALAVVLTLLWPARLGVVSEAITVNPVMAAGVGLLVVGVAIPVLLIAAITILLIPVSLLGFVVIAAAAAFGWSALSLEVGERIGAAAKQEWAPALSAGIGALLLGIIFVGVDQIPCIGWAMQVIIGMICLGAVVVTRAGEEFQQTGS